MSKFFKIWFGMGYIGTTIAFLCMGEFGIAIFLAIIAVVIYLFSIYIKQERAKMEALRELEILNKKIAEGNAEREKQRLEKEMEKEKFAENLLIENSGNIYEAIKEFKEKYNVENDIAKEYVIKVQRKINSEMMPEIKKEKNVPKCPTCGSKDITKLGIIGKMVSTDALGLASSSIGKTFKCKNCGYKW